MLKKNFLICIFLIISLISCSTNVNEISNETNSSEITGAGEIENKTLVLFKNNSSYDVDIYENAGPHYNKTVFTSVKSKETVQVEYKCTAEQITTFHFVYKFNFGLENIAFPYYPKEEQLNHKTLKLISNSKNEIIIDEITACSTKSAFVMLENETTSDIYAIMSDHYLVPYGRNNDDKFIKPKTSAVFELGGESSNLFESASYLKVIANGVIYDLPEIEYERGNIYTFSVITESSLVKTSLKSIAPFNIDTTKKIWSFDETGLYVKENNKPVIKASDNSEEGILVMGALKDNPKAIGFFKIDLYGRQTKVCDFQLKLENSVNGEVQVIDFLQQTDNSIVILAKQEYFIESVKGHKWLYMLVCYDFKENKQLWSEIINSDLIFRTDSKNILLKLEDNRIVLASGVYLYNAKQQNLGCAPILLYYDYSAKKDDGTYGKNGSTKYVLPYGNKGFENESLFTSLIYDGTDIYACGYINCDFNYTAVVHEGIVYKFNATDITTYEKVYSQERCLFISIENTADDWFACGEYWNSEGIGFRGCYISKKMIQTNQKSFPILYSGKNSFTWFSQLCSYQNQIVFCGISSKDCAGTQESLPFVVAYDNSGNKKWENLSYVNYASVLNIIPNQIGTYVIQLGTRSGNIVHYVSADLLGNERSCVQ